MGMFPELNKRKTIANVKEYFEKDFPRLRARFHMNLSSLQSPQFDSVPSHSNVNTQENNIMSSIQAQEYVKATYKIANSAPKKYRIILKTVYLFEQSNFTAMEMTVYEQSQYYRLKNRALLYFAEMFRETYNLNDYSYTDKDLKKSSV